MTSSFGQNPWWSSGTPATYLHGPLRLCALCLTHQVMPPPCICEHHISTLQALDKAMDERDMQLLYGVYRGEFPDRIYIIPFCTLGNRDVGGVRSLRKRSVSDRRNHAILSLLFARSFISGFLANWGRQVQLTVLSHIPHLYIYLSAPVERFISKIWGSCSCLLVDAWLRTEGDDWWGISEEVEGGLISLPTHASAILASLLSRTGWQARRQTQTYSAW